MNAEAVKPAPHKIWSRSKYYLVHHILHADDTPHRIALGLTVGLWFALTPTVGIQIVTIIFVAWLFRCNKAVALLMVWVSNPITTVPIYAGGYYLGAILLGHPPNMELLYSMVGREYDGSLFGTAMQFPSWWDWFKHAWAILMSDLMIPLWVGSLIGATVLSAPLYPVSRWLIIRYRMRRYGSINVKAAPGGVEIDGYKTTLLAIRRRRARGLPHIPTVQEREALAEAEAENTHEASPQNAEDTNASGMQDGSTVDANDSSVNHGAGKKKRNRESNKENADDSTLGLSNPMMSR